MKRALSFVLVLVMLIGMMPVTAFATDTDHIHTYEPTVTAPTCTERGYTTYTCECGDSYVDDYVDATGEHTYANGICTVCGADSVRAVRNGNTLSLSGELSVGTKILVSCYNGERFAGSKILVWNGKALQEEIPEGESVKLFFVDENWLPVRTPVCVE